jgi:hypothetical protein
MPVPLAAFRNAVEPAVEVEVLERRQLAVDERLVPEVAELRAFDVDLELARLGAARPAMRRSRVVLPEPFGPVTSRKSSSPTSSVTPRRILFVPVPLLERTGADHSVTSASTNRKNTTLITPLTVKNAASRRRRSFGRTSECS